ncbi:3-oxo-tetronate kinase [Leifsonia sp. 2TAF2]|uniref:3-oxo-tetronate kinase n=1 Tax=Leifsonia sp. 2TAF2 TaxID=3233009 RepID=UPI003F961F4D
MRLGAVADDVTGACDLAGRVAEAGLPASVLLGTPAADDLPLFPSDGSGCAVVALKVRTAPVDAAVAASTEAARSLLSAGATLLYQKYCSTFDSTPTGNIGPIADALATEAANAAGRGGAVTIGTPATPGARRTQYQGVLFADGIPLAESPMRDHPLTPMRDSNVVRLLTPQTTAPVGLVRWEDVRRGAATIAAQVADGHTLVDALTEDDLDLVADAILRVAGERPVVAGGGAGVGTALARIAVGSATAHAAAALPRVPVTGRLILAGSASAATRRQIAAFGGERHVLDPRDLDRDPRAVLRLRDALAARDDRLAPVLIHASPDVATAQRELGAERAAALLESALSELAAFAVHELGFSHLLVAGGETSGAVTTRLGITRLQIGTQAAPGVPWAVATSVAADERRTIAVLLKSGNFGAAGLFTDAWEVAP